MLLRYCLGLVVIMLGSLSIISQAAVLPEAQIGSFNQAATPVPAEDLKASVEERAFDAPIKPWNVPPVPMQVRGEGISIYYLIPLERVAELIPAELKPIPGPDKIWFRVDCIKWTRLIVIGKDKKEKKVKPFLELDYRFEVMKDDKRGTFPIRMHMDRKYAVLWARQYGDYPVFHMRIAYSNFSPHMHLFQFRNSELATAVVEANPLLGLTADIFGIFNRGEDTALWKGDGFDFVLDPNRKKIKTISRKFDVEIKNAAIETLLLREPLKWKIIAQQEIYAPTKVFILESITGQWFGEQ